MKQKPRPEVVKPLERAEARETKPDMLREMMEDLQPPSSSDEACKMLQLAERLLDQGLGARGGRLMDRRTVRLSLSTTMLSVLDQKERRNNNNYYN